MGEKENKIKRDSARESLSNERLHDTDFGIIIDLTPDFKPWSDQILFNEGILIESG